MGIGMGDAVGVYDEQAALALLDSLDFVLLVAVDYLIPGLQVL